MGTEVASKDLLVPAQTTVALVEFLFPYLASVAWADAGPVSVAAGGAIAISLVGTLSNGDTLLIPTSAATLQPADTSILAERLAPLYAGISPGVTTVTVASIDIGALAFNQDARGNPLTFAGIPDVVLPASPLTVTVT